MMAYCWLAIVRAGGLAHIIVCGEVGADADVVPGHEPKAGNVDAHAVVPEAALVPGRIVGGARDHAAGCADGRGVGEDSVRAPTAGRMSFSGRCRSALAQSTVGGCADRS